ncbi:MAG: EAL domain-containing protein [Cellulomonas sp.]|nr:EAL domain-containing protein [Cellulomonas sp.]
MSVTSAAGNQDRPTGGPGLRALVDASRLGHLTLSATGVITEHNTSAATICGAADLIGRTFDQLLVPADRSRARQLLAAAGGSPVHHDEPLRIRRDGQGSTRVLVSVAALDGPAPQQVSVLMQDDTERYESVRELSHQVDRAATLLRALPDAVLICSPDGLIVEVNDQAQALFGYPADELVGQPIELLVPSETAGAHQWHRARYAATVQSRPMSTGPDVHGRTKDGRLVPVEVNLATARTRTGPVMVASVRDVTDARAQAGQLTDSLHLLSGVLRAATEQAIIATDLTGTILTWSRGAELMFGYTGREAIGRPASFLNSSDADSSLADTWGLDGNDSTADRVAVLVTSEVAATRPWVYLHKSGAPRHVLLSVTVRHAGNRPAGLILVATDQSQRMAAEAALAASEERFRSAFEHAPIGVALVSVAAPTLGTFLQVNPTLATLLGYTAAELDGATLADLTHPEDLPLIIAAFDRLVLGEPVGELIEHRLLDADARVVWVQVSLALVPPDATGRDAYVVAMVADITARRAAELALTHNALHDQLTGLPNRALIAERLTQSLNRARRTQSGVGVLYVDLDNFKDVNDSLGHAAGDELLIEVARRLAGCMQDSDTVGRLGGDEFIVVCEDVHDAAEVTAVAQRVGHVLAIQVPVAGQMVTSSASIGIVHTQDWDVAPEDLLREAGIAMFRAKGNGRARYEFSDPELQTRALRQIELEADLRATLDAQYPGHDLSAQAHPRRGAPVRHPQVGRLFLAYQPCFDAGSGKVTACEALLRWEHPTRGVLSPGQFLDVAEERSLMAPLGAWVLRQATRQAAAWVERFGQRAPEMWVNVSASQMGRHQFSAEVAAALAETGLPAAKLWVELTERQALSSAHSVLDDLNALPAMGVRLAIDDFGTGYAGLDYLRRLPVSALKVDASYVAAIGQDRTGTALAASVVNLGHALDLTVVAEGVETEEQKAAVTGLGADTLQGFLLARPGPPEQVEELLMEQSVTST